MRDEFVLPIDGNKFRSTNSAWNRLMLNDPWSVGYVSSLIETQEWTSKEEWESFYYKSGEDRKRLIVNNPNRTLIEDFTLQINNKNVIYSLSWNDKNLNYQYGRTKDDLEQKASALYESVKNNGLGITLDECFQCVRYRTICETWNGIIIRENNTVSNLKSMFPSIVFKKTDGNTDHTFAVDYELFYNGKLILGIQVKPKSYLGNAPYLKAAQYANQKKYAAYKAAYDVDVLTIVSKTNGEVINVEALDKIKRLCQMP